MAGIRIFGRFTKALGLAAAMAVMGVFPQQALAQTYMTPTVVDVTSTPPFVFFDANDNGQAVWVAMYPNQPLYQFLYDVFLWDGSQIVQLTNSPDIEKSAAQINNSGQAVWAAADGMTADDIYSLYFWDGAQITEISPEIPNAYPVSISDAGTVLFRSYDSATYAVGFYLWHGQQTIELTSRGSSIYPVQNNSGTVVWYEWALDGGAIEVAPIV